MQKHFLVTLSNDVDHLYGVQFVCNFFSKASEHRITLLHICAQGNSTHSELLEIWQHPDDRIRGHLTVGARRALDKAMEMISSSRMSVDGMCTKTVAEKYGKVKDILSEGVDGVYDAIVLGRRASYAFQSLFERPADEMAKAILNDSLFSLPIWSCPNVSRDRSGVLVCLDGSESSWRAVDHVGYVLTRQPQHQITLFHVATLPGEEKLELFDRARELLSEHNIDPQRIEVRQAWGLNIAGQIKAEADRGGYAAVALGRHGLEGKLLKSYSLAGGTVIKLITSLENVSLWCCP